MDDFPEPQKKPQKKPNYQERVRLGLQRGGLRPVSKKGQQRRATEAKEHNKNTEASCHCCGATESLEKHHPHGRSKPDVFVYLCGPFGCRKHHWIHEHPNDAYKEGWLQPSYRGLKDDPNHPKPWL